MRTTFLLVLIPGLLALLSCASSESYYLLSAQTPMPTGASRALRIGVGPLLIPDYIDRSEIVFQSSPNKFEIPAGHLWAGSLQDNMLSVLATNLSRGLNTTDVRTYPWEPGSPLDYTVSIDVLRYHAQTGGDAVLEANWRLYDEASRSIVSQRHSLLARPMKADGYEAVVSTQSLLLSDLAEEIAAGLRR